MKADRFSGGDLVRSIAKDSDTGLNRQILSNSVKRKAMEDLCERTRKLIRKVQSQDLDTLTYTHRTLGGAVIKHAPPNCFFFQQILKILMKQ